MFGGLTTKRDAESEGRDCESWKAADLSFEFSTLEASSFDFFQRPRDFPTYGWDNEYGERAVEALMKLRVKVHGKMTEPFSAQQDSGL